jgi:hypothetical protein
LSLEDRFKHWAAHKVSICLPLAGDVSQRLFDALVTGQIPIVPPDLYDLDTIIPPEVQNDLPVIRFHDYSTAAVDRAHRQALQAFQRGGKAGAERRHAFAMRNHMFPSRIRDIILRVKNMW